MTLVYSFICHCLSSLFHFTSHYPFQSPNKTSLPRNIFWSLIQNVSDVGSSIILVWTIKPFIIQRNVYSDCLICCSEFLSCVLSFLYSVVFSVLYIIVIYSFRFLFHPTEHPSFFISTAIKVYSFCIHCGCRCQCYERRSVFPIFYNVLRVTLNIVSVI